MSAVAPLVSDVGSGAEAEPTVVIDTTAGLRGLTATWEDVQRARLAAHQRGLLPVAEQLALTERALARQISRALRSHVLYDWLPSGLRGVHVARLLALIDDPWRFPGRRCTRGHYLSVAEAAREVDTWPGDGGPCPVETHDGPCDGTLLPPRPGTGVRSLWHYCGVHVVDGRSPRRRKGQRADWNPVARTILLMPGGVAEQIVRLRVAGYRATYDAVKARLIETRAVPALASEDASGARDGTEADAASAIVAAPGLRPVQIDAIARKVAAKQFLGDLLTEWKRRLPVRRDVIDGSRGEAAA